MTDARRTTCYLCRKRRMCILVINMSLAVRICATCFKREFG
jgi:hypothetical protein